MRNRRHARAVRLTAIGAALALVLVGASLPAGISSAAPASRDASPTPTPTPTSLAARAALAAAIGPGAVVETERPLGALRWVANLDGTLSGPSASAPRDIALGYVLAHLDAFGLTQRDVDLLSFRDDYVDILGTHHLSWVERVDGVPFFGAGLKVAVASDGSLISLAGPIYHIAQLTGPIAPRLSASEALGAARADAAPHARIERWASMPRDRARLVRFAAPAAAGLAWDTTTAISPERIIRSVVDATTGRVLWRENLVRNDQTGSGLAWPEAPGPFAGGGGVQVPVTFPVAGPDALSGNNAHVYTAVSGSDQLGPQDEVAAADAATLSWGQAPVLDTTTSSQNCSPTYPCTWNYATPYSWKTNRRQEAVEAYYLLNAYHDHLEAPPIGFTEAAGNFQVVNGSGLGLGGDPIEATTLVGANLGRDGRPRILNNASMYTPPDGTPGRMALYLFRRDRAHPAGPTADAADDATVVYHEYTHGLSGRLVTMPDGSEGLYGVQSGAMSEGWSDWYALDDLVAAGYQVDTPEVDVPVAPWISGGEGSRPQFADCLPSSRGPGCEAAVSSGPGGFTYGDFGRIAGEPEVHDDGEIWLQTLWQLRTALGSSLTEALVTRAMELSPQAPSFLEERDAILIADGVVNDGADLDTIWHVFARRGMGFFASTRSTFDLHPVEDFSLPTTCPGTGCGTLFGQVVDPTTDAPVPGILVHLAPDQLGVPVDLSATSDANGRFRISGVPDGLYRNVTVSGDGYRTVWFGPVTVDGDTHLHPEIRRDWATPSGGARIESVTGPDRTTALGACGPQGILDGSLTTSWLTSIKEPAVMTIRLPAAVNITDFGVDPSAMCAGTNAATRSFRILTRTQRGTWTVAYSTSAPLSPDHVTTLRPGVGWRGVRFIRLVLRAAEHSGTQVEFTELTVHGVAAVPSP